LQIFLALLFALRCGFIRLLYSSLRGLCAFVEFRHRQKCLLTSVMGGLHVSLTSTICIKTLQNSDEKQ